MIFNGKKSLIFNILYDEKIIFVGCKLYMINKSEYDEFKNTVTLLEMNLKSIFKELKCLKGKGLGT